jgi:hypothetical protein
MTVLEYFDYEAQLLDDLQNVKTIHARNAIQSELVKMLKDHKQFVYNTIKQFEDRIRENAQAAGQIMQGQTPDYVKKMMAEFGFHELEECDDTVSPPSKYKYAGANGKKLTPKRIKQLCADASTSLDEKTEDQERVVYEHNKVAEELSAVVKDPQPADKPKATSRKRSKKAQA